MTARVWFHPEAGSWVAFRDEPKRRRDPKSRSYVLVPGEVTRCYLYDVRTGTGLIGSPVKCVRFDTRHEALTAARARWPQRVRGCRIGAEQVAS